MRRIKMALTGIYRVQALRRAGTAADWTAENIVLANGEFGVETDSGKSKIGDGATVWSALAYVGATGSGSGVTSVAGRSGAVVLTASDVSGVATPASVATAIAAIPAAPVTSVAGRTGVITLAATDVTGVATPASVATQITAAAPVAATASTNGLVKQLVFMGPQTFTTVADAQTSFNALLLALIAKGIMASS
jgi:hypothetical protein